MTVLPLILAAAVGAAAPAPPAPAAPATPAQAAPAQDALPPAVEAPPEPAVSPEVAKTGAMLEITIEKLRTGKPDYTAMEPVLALKMRGQESEVRQALDKLGPIASIDYIGPMQTAHRFRVVFENATTVWIIGLASDGKIRTLVFRGV